MSGTSGEAESLSCSSTSLAEPQQQQQQQLQHEQQQQDLEPEDVGSSKIQVYLRMRPMEGRCYWHRIGGPDKRTLITTPPRGDSAFSSSSSITLNNTRNEYRFQFDGIYDEHATQEEVFSDVALPVVNDALRGINGTIFAYGQTGTGKTYTITGGAEAFELRGIIPRALARVFDFVAGCTSQEFSLAVSYLEIYQDKGYDLLMKAEKPNSNSSSSSRNLEDLKRVYAVADEQGNVCLRGLSVNPVRTEEEALNLLFIGDANRIVAETPLNDCSTRSHCIFTVWIASKERGSSSTKKAKLHLVDLAGSERVKQSGTRPGDCIFQEACSINLTLHYLEQVIVALQQKAAGQATHVPYRNSLMTSVLKDSLGGNCKTRMIATVALELYAINETINTCRFAQAVAQVRNAAEINEEEEASAIIQRLQKENEKLRGQLQLAAAAAAATGDDAELTEEANAICRDAVERFLMAEGADLQLPVTAARDLRSADVCFRLMRDKYKELKTEMTDANADGRCRRRDCKEALQRLQLHVEQRDAEIATLLGIIHQSSDPACTNSSSNGIYDPLGALTRAAVEAAVRAGSGFREREGGKEEEEGKPWLAGTEATALLKDRGRAFEMLRRSARKTEFLEADSRRMQELYEEANKCREEALKAKEKIAEARSSLEKIRIRKCLQQSGNRGEIILDEEETPEETQVLQQVAVWRDEYIKNINELSAAKRELKRLYLTVERNRKKLQQDFEGWFNTIANREENELPVLPNSPRGNSTISGLPVSLDSLHESIWPNAYPQKVESKLAVNPTQKKTCSITTPWPSPRIAFPPGPENTDQQLTSAVAPPTAASSTPSFQGVSELQPAATASIKAWALGPVDMGTHCFASNRADDPSLLSAQSNYPLDSRPVGGNPPNEVYTGDPSADADIKAFYEAVAAGTGAPVTGENKGKEEKQLC
ncbi:kinesin motor domain-containing protein, putative [Eimeria acervulina]|uniref:Kinesin-like protein n=1 Tax=Eimeria acervulina TaxID=5801 RepID=U6GJS6_EIMAC|nr:kinesin motor domain-containing protein, putative [Eimeria acervulina]CDI79832.1 kinesin motor domain-containing protein, putative [Eimeria acervulina]